MVMRTLIFSGKGGVGKTSVSAATARRCAQLGYKTIIMSVDTAHSLADSLEVELSSEIVNVSENLDALELNIIHEMRTKWSSVNEYISSFLISQGMEDISAEEMAILPGMEMVAALLYVLQFKEEGKYDVVVIDTAPSGETVRLLSFPDMSDWYLNKMFNLAKRVMSLARLTVGKVVDMPIPSKDVMNTISDIRGKMARVKTILEDSENTSIRLVLNPERMPINETMRSYTYLCLYNYTVEALIVNKMLPHEAGVFFKEKLREQEVHMEEIHRAFDPLTIQMAYQFPTEVSGSSKLDMLADQIFGKDDPTRVYSTESPMRFYTEKDADVIEIRMPFLDKGKLDLYLTKDSSLIVNIGPQKRKIALPMTLMGAEILRAKFDDKDEKLRVYFRRYGDE